jgi:iron complex outermembrane receptor protein
MTIEASIDDARSAAAAPAVAVDHLLTAPILPTLLRLAVPNTIAMFGSTLVAVAETSYIGRLGTEPLAGIALVFPFAMLNQMMSAGAMGGGVSSAISRALGAGDRDRAADLALQGSHTLAGLRHRWTVGLLRTQHTARFNRQAYNYAGNGFVDGSAVVPPDPTLTDDNTDRDERSTELRVQDAVTLGPQWQLWAGARHPRIERDSVRTDGSRTTSYAQGFTTPWLALAWQLQPTLMAYASWGQGIESEVAPNRTRYVNAGQALPALKSRQLEAGLKHRSARLQWQMALFDVSRPQWSDIQASTGLPSDACSDADPCNRRPDGGASHRGLEVEAEWQVGPWSLRGSALALRARREGAADSATNARRPTNVPERSVKLQAAYNVGALPGLALLGFATHEGARAVVPDNRVFTEGWTRVDLGLRYAHAAGGLAWVWRAGLDNATNARAWKESPYQFGHAYLYPLAPRTWRAALSVTL